MQLNVTEIFHSIQGEGTSAGLPFVFIRLAGCNLRCSYCDTAYAQSDGQKYSIREIVEKAAQFSCSRVLITGGEPLLQPEVGSLARALFEKGMEIFIETNGTMPIDRLESLPHIIMDIKTPGSGADKETLWENLAVLRPVDEIKFVITSKEDFDWALGVIKERDLAGRTLIFQPAWDAVPSADLAQWILDSRAPVRMGLQLHKIIWPEKSRGI